jgi:HEAT repeat protein
LPPLQLEHVRLALDPDVPVFVDFERLGSEAFELLARVVLEPDVRLAAAALRLCAHLRGEGAFSVLDLGVRHRNPILREAAALALAHRSDHPPAMLVRLLNDPEVAVRARALEAVGAKTRAARLRYVRVLRRLHREDPDPRVRAMARQAFPVARSRPRVFS